MTAKNIILLKSSMPIEGYVKVKRRCICCGKWQIISGEIRKEDAEQLEKNNKPVCEPCANFIRKRDAEQGLLRKQKLQSLKKEVVDYIFSIIAELEEGEDEWLIGDDVKRRWVEIVGKKFGELLKA